MDLLTLSRAARFAGVSRGTLQAKISAGELESFEGAVRVIDLLRVFPSTELENTAQLKRMQQIKDAAIGKAMPEDSPGEFALLRMRVEHMEQELQLARRESAEYREIVNTLADKLTQVQAHCDQRQRMMLETVLSWLLHRLHRSR